MYLQTYVFYVIGCIQVDNIYLHLLGCKDPTEYGTYVSAMVCDHCKCGYILPITALNFKVLNVYVDLIS